MGSRRKVLAIIPARGGSKRLLNKNILPLAGKPLIGWTINAAIKSEIFDKIVVTTDSADIADVAKSAGATIPFLRPPELSGDKASSIDVVMHTLRHFSAENFTDIVLLQPTSPLRTQLDLQESWQEYVTNGFQNLISVCESEHPIQWTYKIEGNRQLKSLFPANQRRSQDCEVTYRVNGAIYIVSVASLLENKAFFIENKTISYLMSALNSLDIDTELDFKISEILLKERIENA